MIRERSVRTPRIFATRVAAIVAIKDAESDPKVLLARRLLGVNKGLLTLPGGKGEDGETFEQTAMREMPEETGRRIWSPEYLIGRHRSPVEVNQDGFWRRMQIFYIYYDEATDGAPPERREPNKHGPWRWYPVGALDRLVAQRVLHPAVTRRLWQDEEIILPDRLHGMTVNEFDFPHGGLHPVERLRESLGIR